MSKRQRRKSRDWIMAFRQGRGIPSARRATGISGSKPLRQCMLAGVQPASMRHPGAGRPFPDIPVRKLRAAAQQQEPLIPSARRADGIPRPCRKNIASQDFSVSVRPGRNVHRLFTYPFVVRAIRITLTVSDH